MKIMLDMCGLRAWQRWLFIAAFSIVFSWAMTGPGIADHVEINDFAPEQEEPLDPDAADGCESRMAVMSAAWFVEFRQRLPWLLHVD